MWVSRGDQASRGQTIVARVPWRCETARYEMCRPPGSDSRIPKYKPLPRPALVYLACGNSFLIKMRNAQGHLYPHEYYDLLSFLTNTGRFYIEFTAHGSLKSQFPVTISQLPKCPDDLHEYPEKIKFSLESRYMGSPGYVDFSIIIVQDDDEMVSDDSHT